MAKWVLNRRPQHKAGSAFETERPSPSYVIDVGLILHSLSCCVNMTACVMCKL